MLSIVIPCFREHDLLPAALQRLRALMAQPEDCEVIVADAHFDARSENAVDAAGMCYLPVGMVRRSAQMHAGAMAAQGDVLLFLHIDTVPPLHFDALIGSAIRTGFSAGCFRMRFDDTAPFFRFFGWCTKLPWGLARGGDQGLYVAAALYHRTGGFSTHMDIMEDIDMWRKLRRKGPFHIIASQATTSARRYHAIGKYKLQTIFAYIHLLYWMGASQEKLLKAYRLAKGPSRVD
jgi:rSAM/selenodomain-associated transferase 2